MALEVPGTDDVPGLLRALVGVIQAQGQAITRLTQEVRELRGQATMEGATAVPVETAAMLLGCGRSRVFELLTEGRLRRGKRTGRHCMVTRQSIEALLAAGDAEGVRPRPDKPPEQMRAEVLRLIK